MGMVPTPPLSTLEAEMSSLRLLFFTRYYALASTGAEIRDASSELSECRAAVRERGLVAHQVVPRALDEPERSCVSS